MSTPDNSRVVMSDASRQEKFEAFRKALADGTCPEATATCPRCGDRSRIVTLLGGVCVGCLLGDEDRIDRPEGI